MMKKSKPHKGKNTCKGHSEKELSIFEGQKRLARM